MSYIVIGIFDNFASMKQVLYALVKYGFTHLGPVISFSASTSKQSATLTNIGIPKAKAKYFAKLVKSGNKLLTVYVEENINKMLKQAEEVMVKHKAKVISKFLET